MIRFSFLFFSSLFFAQLANADRCAIDAVFSSRQVAENAGLHYLESYPNGVTRTATEDGWSYRSSSGKIVTRESELSRIKSLNIPKGYKDVWISEDPLSHIQAIGKDGKNETQYRYHPLWKEAKKKIKFARMIEFSDALPTLHEKVAADLLLKGFPKNKILATVATIMEQTGIRVGSAEYAAKNKTYGLTTFLKKHLTEVTEEKATFDFIGKAREPHKIDFTGGQVAKILKDLKKLPGKNLFQYQDEDGIFHAVNAHILNDYLAESTGGDFTAKDYRTWMGTMTAARHLIEKENTASASVIKKNIISAIDAARDRLGNTRAVARENYIEPTLLSVYENDPTAFAKAKAIALKEVQDGKTPEERLMRILMSDVK